jgi:hypothetical protein
MTSELWTRENLAWLAGIFEGEGYVQGRPRTYKRKDGREFTTVGFRMTISMTDEDVITRAHQIAGVGNLNGPRRSPSMVARGAKPMWDFDAAGVEAYALCVALWSWLGERRRSQMKTAMEAWLQSPGHWSKKKIKI